MAESFPVLHVKGNHYDIGYITGSTFQSRIQTYIQKSDIIQNSLLPFYDSSDGREVVETVLSLTERNYPVYVDEIRGMALGAGLPFETMFMNNMQMDIYFGYFSQSTYPGQSPKQTQEDLGCTTVFVNRPDVKVIGHNEDGETIAKSYGYFIDATVLHNGEETEKFTSLCYPGCLPGNAMNFNKHGLIFTINTLASPAVTLTTPIGVIHRALLTAADIREVKQTVSNVGYGVSAGVNINVGSVVDTSCQWSVEVVAALKESKVHIKTIPESDSPEDSTYFHMNEYRHTDMQIDTSGTSIARLKTALGHPLPTCARDVRNILGDTSNQSYPIYRSPRPTDGAGNICTGLFDLLGRTLSVYLDKPSKDAEPLISFKI